EERVLALLHRFEISTGDEIAHARPRLALGAALDLVVPGKCLGLGFQKPIRHRLLLYLASPAILFRHCRLDPAIHRLRKTRMDPLVKPAGDGGVRPRRGTAASTALPPPRRRWCGRRGCRRRRPRSACRPLPPSPSRPAPAR